MDDEGNRWIKREKLGEKDKEGNMWIKIYIQ